VKVRRTTGYLACIVAGSVIAAAYDGLAYWEHVEPTGAFAAAWPLVFLILSVLWVVEDSKSHPDVYKPFEFGFLVLMWAIPYLPYYLWHTRRFRGLLMLLGFVVLFALGSLTRLAIDLAR